MTTPSDKSMLDQLAAELLQTKKQVEQLTSELKEAKANLQQLVYRDGLSGLYNHRHFQEMVSQELERSLRYSSPFSLAIFDLDAFADFNETYGHESGDLVLMNIAKVLEREVRPSDIVARYGGEEFAVILPETDFSGLKVFAGRLCQSVQDMATIIGGKEVRTTICIGGATFVPGSASVNKRDIVYAVEQALSSAKKKGSNQISLVELPEQTS